MLQRSIKLNILVLSVEVQSQHCWFVVGPWPQPRTRSSRPPVKCLYATPATPAPLLPIYTRAAAGAKEIPTSSLLIEYTAHTPSIAAPSALTARACGYDGPKGFAEPQNIFGRVLLYRAHTLLKLYPPSVEIARVRGFLTGLIRPSDAMTSPRSAHVSRSSAKQATASRGH